MKRSRIALVIAAVALVGGAGVFAARAPSSPLSVTASPHAWPADVVSHYDVAWRTHAVATIAAEGKASLGSDVQAKGELLVRSYGERDGVAVLGVRWGRVDGARVEAMGREIVDSGELSRQLLAADAVVRVEPSGVVRDLRFSRETTPLARGVLRAMVLEVCAQVAAASGEGEVDTALGRARVSRAQDGATVTTVRSRYDSLEAFPEGLLPEDETVVAKGRVELDGTRALRAIHSTEDVSVAASDGPVEAFESKTEFTASLSEKKSEALGAPPAYAATELRPRGKEGNDYDRHASLERRSVGVTYETLFADVRSAAVLPREGATAWIWHDSAFLELHPEHADKLIAQASRELDLPGQAAAFDIVVVSGTAEAQRSLTAAMTRFGNKDDATYVTLVQRLGHLRHPTEATIAFMESEYRALKGKERGCAVAYTLGALASAARDERPEQARAIVAKLTGDLAASRDDQEREALVRGLGNAGFESSVPALVALRASEDSAVRGAVASALRKIESPAALEALVALATDADTGVAINALMSLFRKTLDDGTWLALQRAWDEGRIPDGAHDAFVNGLAAHRAETPRAAAILVAVVSAPNVHPKTRQRVESVLRQ